MTIKTSLIFAMARNRALGFKGDLPWHIPDDLKRFKELTLGHTCLMGRKTFESIVARLGQPLPGRTTLIVSKNGYEYGHIPVFPDVAEAIDAAKMIALHHDQSEIFVIGGAQVYQASLPYADRLYMTAVDLIVPGDVFMPEWPEDAFRETARTAIAGSPSFEFINYDRV